MQSIFSMPGNAAEISKNKTSVQTMYYWWLERMKKQIKHCSHQKIQFQQLFNCMVQYVPVHQSYTLLHKNLSLTFVRTLKMPLQFAKKKTKICNIMNSVMIIIFVIMNLIIKLFITPLICLSNYINMPYIQVSFVLLLLVKSFLPY
jgi:hypothetical protein